MKLSSSKSGEGFTKRKLISHRPWPWVFFAVIAVFCIGFLFIEYFKSLGTSKMDPISLQVDFSGYYVASSMLKKGRTEIYNPKLVNRYAWKNGFFRRMNYGGLINYPPSFYMMMIPVTYMKYKSALVFWLVVNHLLLFWSGVFIFLTFRNIYGKKVEQYWFFIIVFFILSLFFSAVIDELAMGQTGILVTFLSILSIYFYTKGDKIIAGIPLGIAGAMKGLPLFFLLYFIWKKKWKPVAAAAATFAIVMAIPGFIWGWSLILSFFRAMDRVALDWSNWMVDQSLNSVLTVYLPYLSPSRISTIKYLMTIGFIAATLYAIRGELSPEDEVLSFALVMILLSVIVHYAHPHNHVTLIAPIGFYLFHFLRSAPWDRLKTWLFYLFVIVYGVISCTMSGFVGIRFLELKKTLLRNKIPYFAVAALWIIIAYLLDFVIKRRAIGKTEVPGE